jgi:precorrin-6B methylase 2
MVHALRGLLRRVGLLAPLDRWAAGSMTGRWARSLLAVYDLDDLRRLDLPWWTLDAAAEVADFLAHRDAPTAFEWGSGSSTIWLARRCARVTSVEHDEEWAAAMQADLPDNATVTAVPAVVGGPVMVGSRKKGFAGQDFSAYVAAIDSVTGSFDVIVIDGRAREACLASAVGRLAPGGVIVFDNVERRRYRKAIASLGSTIAVDARWGRTACLPYPTRTALIRVVGA